MRILVVGAGAIGILIGHRLQVAGHQVTLLGRPALQEAAAREGMFVTDQLGTHRVTADVVTSVDRFADIPELIIITVKAHDTAAAAQHLLPIASQKIPILLIQNGVGGEAAGIATLPSAIWFGAVTTLVADRPQIADVRQTKRRGSITLAPLRNAGSADVIAGILRSAGVRQVRTHHSYDVITWSKLLLNILGNAVPAIVDMSPAATFRHPDLFAVERAAYREAVCVMRGLHLKPIPLPGYPVPLLAWAILHLPATLLRPLLSRLMAGGRGGKMPSLHRDLMHQRSESEVLFLNGAVVRHGERMGISTPVNRAITDTLIALSRGEQAWDRYRGKPGVLRDLCSIS